ncbi:MAG: hypothetical protein B7Z78_09580 [Rhodospirillales bacterium 20-60-12]|nr:MAG: hypothetical protein B7Z78_09580 [Rhodospirillales bacterium 20-60-12]
MIDKIHIERVVVKRSRPNADFGQRILPFDSGAAFAYSEIFEIRRRAGRPAATLDLMIAAIARFRSCILVTRNESDFELCGIEIINPWRSL